MDRQQDTRSRRQAYLAAEALLNETERDLQRLRESIPRGFIAPDTWQGRCQTLCRELRAALQREKSAVSQATEATAEGNEARRKLAAGPERAFAALIMPDRTWGIGLATENEAGFEPIAKRRLASLAPELLSLWGEGETTESQMRELATRLNREIFAITETRSLLITLSSMHPCSSRMHEARKRDWDADEKRAAERAAERKKSER